MDERACILNAVQEEYSELLAPTGMRFLDWTEVGSFQLAGTESFTSPKPIEGLRLGGAAKIRSPISSGSVSAFSQASFRRWKQPKVLPRA